MEEFYKKNNFWHLLVKIDICLHIHEIVDIDMNGQTEIDW